MSKTIKATRPEDVLADNETNTNLDGIVARKGSVAAFLKNIDILEDPSAKDSDKETALSIMRELAPVLVGVGLYKHASFKNLAVQEILEEAHRRQEES
jgi:hypothetical protein